MRTHTSNNLPTSAASGSAMYRLPDGRRVKAHHLPAIWDKHLRGMLKDWQGCWGAMIPVPDPLPHLDSALGENRHLAPQAVAYLLDTLFGAPEVCAVADDIWRHKLALAQRLDRMRDEGISGVTHGRLHGWSDLEPAQRSSLLVALDKDTVLCFSALPVAYPMHTHFDRGGTETPRATQASTVLHLRRPHRDHPWVEALHGWARQRRDMQRQAADAVDFMAEVCEQNVPLASLEAALPQAAGVVRLLLETRSSQPTGTSYSEYWAACAMSRPTPFDTGVLRRAIPDYTMRITDVAATAHMMATAFMAQARRVAEGWTPRAIPVLVNIVPDR